MWMLSILTDELSMPLETFLIENSFAKVPYTWLFIIKLSLKIIGVNSSPCEEPEVDETLCGSNDWTYTSLCKFKQEYCMGNIGLRFNYWGECTAKVRSIL